MSAEKIAQIKQGVFYSGNRNLSWISELPPHWRVEKLKYLASLRFSNVDKHTNEEELPVRLCNYTDVYYHDLITEELDFMNATATPEEIASFGLRAGDVIVTKDSETWDDIAVPAYVPSDLEGVICGYHLAQIRPHQMLISGKYLFRALNAHGIREQFHLAANGVTRYGLSQHALKSGLFPVPPRAEQDAIVAFLDEKLADIDRYIAAKQRLIELLNEQKAAIINRAVTRGLDETAPVKESGIEWLGKVPAHWKATRLKFVAQVQTGLTLGKNYGSRKLENRPYLRVANVQNGYLNLSDIATLDLPHEEALKNQLQPGDVLMTEGGDRDKLGRGCIWHGEIEGCLHQNHIFAVRPNNKILLPEFLVKLMGAEHGRTYFLTTAKQTTNLASTNSTTLRALPLFLPNLEEQTRILHYITLETAEFDQAIEKAQREIELMQELRTALIAEAVTGKLDLSARHQEVSPNGRTG